MYFPPLFGLVENKQKNWNSRRSNINVKYDQKRYIRAKTLNTDKNVKYDQKYYELKNRHKRE